MENDCTLNTTVWLKFEANCNHVLPLKCAAYSQFKEKLISMHNYHLAFVEGTTNMHFMHFN